MPATEPQVVWRPQPGPQTAFLECPVFEILYGGARGGGKSDAVLGEWGSHAALYGDAAIGLVVRRELKQLQELIQRSKQIYGPLGAEWHSQDKYWIFPNGARLNFAYLENDDDAEKYQGWSLTRIFVEEIGNFPEPAPLFKLMATLRSGKGVPCGFRATGNPGGPGHQWVKARYIDPAPGGYKIIKSEFTNPFTAETTTRDRTFIPAKIIDNKFNNVPEYVAQLQMVGNERMVRAWLFGDWDVIIGAYFDNWDARKHVIRPIPISSKWLRFCAGDWGSAKPFSFGWYAVVGDAFPIARMDGSPGLIPRGAIIKYRELYGSLNHDNVGVKLTVEQVADRIHEAEAREPKDLDGKSGIKYRTLDPACFADEGGATIAERFGGKRLYFTPANNQRTRRHGNLGGWDMVRQRLDGEDGRPMLYFFSTCVDSIRTIPALQHDKNNAEDVDSEAEDHAGDETRYACMSRPWIRTVHPAIEPAMSEADDRGNVKIDLNRLFTMNERARRQPAARSERL